MEAQLSGRLANSVGSYGHYYRRIPLRDTIKLELVIPCGYGCRPGGRVLLRRRLSLGRSRFRRVCRL